MACRIRCAWHCVFAADATCQMLHSSTSGADKSRLIPLSMGLRRGPRSTIFVAAPYQALHGHHTCHYTGRNEIDHAVSTITISLQRRARRYTGTMLVIAQAVTMSNTTKCCTGVSDGWVGESIGPAAVGRAALVRAAFEGVQVDPRKYSHGLHSCGLFSYGLCSYFLCTYGLYSYGLCTAQAL